MRMHVLDFSVPTLQRVAIARALLKNAPILILDEVIYLVNSSYFSFCPKLCISEGLLKVPLHYSAIALL